MSFHVLTLRTDSTWRTTPDEFSSAVRRKWPDAEITPLDAPDHCLEVTVRIGAHDLAASLARDGCTLMLYGGPTQNATFACWYRTLVPATEPLFLYSDDFDFLYEVKPETTPTDIILARTGQPTWD